MEQWLDVVGFEGIYEISNHGYVRSSKTKQFKKITFANFLAGVNNLIQQLQDNVALLSFRLQVALGLSYQKFVGSFVDEYQDESGVDLVNSANEFYSSLGKFYRPTGGSGPTYALQFNHISGQRMEATVPGITTAFTLEYYFNYQGGTGHLLDFNRGAYSGFPCITSQFDNDNHLYVFLADFAAQYGVVITQPLNHVAITYDGANVNFWLNGVLVAGPTSVSWDFTGINNDITVGSNVVGDPSCTGIIDEVRISNTCRYTVAFVPSYVEFVPDSYTLALWHFDEGSGDVTADSSGNGYDGVLSGSPVWCDGLVSGSITGYDNMTLISQPQTAKTIPTKARIILLEEDIDSVTLNTDLIVYASRDGVNYTPITLTDEGDFDSTQRILAGEAVFSTASGVAMKYKICTLNNKGLKIHGTGLLWA